MKLLKGIYKKCFFSVCIFILGNIVFAHAQQWTLTDTIMYTSKSNKLRTVTINFWTDASISNVKGLIIVNDVICDFTFAKNSLVRQVAKEEELAIIQLTKGFSEFNAAGDDGVQLQRVLDKMAMKSGYPSVKYAPWFTFGHSTSGIFSYNLAWYKPERTFGVITYKSGKISPPSWAAVKKDSAVNNVPILVLNGQFEEYGPYKNGTIPPGVSNEVQWWAMRDSVNRMRQSGALISLYVEPNGKHGTCTASNFSYLADFLKACAQAKLPLGYPTNGLLALKKIDIKSGYLSDTTNGLLLKNNETYHLDSIGRYAGSIWSFDSLFRLRNASQVLDSVFLGNYTTFYNSLINPRYSYWHFNEKLYQNWLTFHHNNWGEILNISRSEVLTSVKNVEAETSLTLFPNPVQSNLTLENQNLEWIKMEIYSLEGKKIYESPINQIHQVISLNSIVPGIYTLRLYSKKGHYRITKLTKD